MRTGVVQAMSFLRLAAVFSLATKMDFAEKIRGCKTQSRVRVRDSVAAFAHRADVAEGGQSLRFAPNEVAKANCEKSSMGFSKC
jgi:hypothetical protein